MPVRSLEVKRTTHLLLDAAIDTNSNAWAPYRKRFRQLSKDRQQNDDLALHHQILANAAFPWTLSFNYMGGTHEEDEGKVRERIAPVEWDRHARVAMLVAVDTKVGARKYYSPLLIYDVKADT